jgi:hypothetical protein
LFYCQITFPKISYATKKKNWKYGLVDVKNHMPM